MSRGSPRPTSSGSDERPRRRRYRSLERVRLTRDLPEHGLKRGESGTIVHVFDTTHAYLVEFVDPADGSTRAAAELTPEQIRPA